MDYHVFKKTKINKKGKRLKYWYYYYTVDGKQIQKVCKNCKTRADAEDYIRTLPSLSNQNKTKIKDIAASMYLRGGDHYSRRIQLGKSVDEKTMSSNRAYALKIIDKWGQYDIEAVEPSKILDYLFTIDRSGSWKNCYLGVFKEIYEEAIWYGSKISKPAFPSFARNSKKADILTTEELSLLFKEENFPNEMMFLFFLPCVSGGMRLGEVRAVRVKQILFDRKVLIIDGFCKQDGRRTVYNKKGSIEKPKLRAVHLPEVVLQRLELWVRCRRLLAEEFCFTQNKKPIRSEYAEDVFYRALQRIQLIPMGKGIKHLPPTDGRRLIPHSLRYTYISRMLRVMSPEELKSYTGHVDVAMVDYYNRYSLDLQLEKLPGKGKDAVNTLFD